MLIEFSVGNYLSFKETVTLSLVASKVIDQNETLDENNIFDFDENLTLLKSAAVYGANASGKSNLIKAIGFMHWFIINSSKETQVTDQIDVKEFKLSTQTEGKPSFFQIVFILKGKIYKYGFEVTRERVISEWLYYVPNIKETKLFERNFDTINIKSGFKKEGKELFKITRQNALFLSVLAQFNGKISTQILFFLRDKLNVISGLNNQLYKLYTSVIFPQYSSEIIQLIKQLDLDIDNITIAFLHPSLIKLSNRSAKEIILLSMRDDLLSMTSDLLRSIKIQTFHKKYNSQGEVVSLEKFDLDQDESEGTKKLFAFAGLLLKTLKDGEILIIDELDAKLHPLMTRTLINLFNSKTTNPHNAQLVFTTHDTNLLSSKIFRLDQIWFTEKNNQSSTDLYSLVEYKVSDNSSLESDYIKGKYGAIPFIGNLSQLLNELNEQQESFKEK